MTLLLPTLTLNLLLSHTLAYLCTMWLGGSEFSLQGFRVCGVRQNLYVYSLYRNPDLYNRIFDCLLASMAAVQAEDVPASFLFVGDLNGQSGVVGFNDHEPSWSCGL